MQKLVFLVMVWSLTFSTAQAAVTDAEFADLKAGLVSVLKRIEALEAENSKLRLASEQLREQNISISKAAQSGNKSSWTDTMAIKKTRTSGNGTGFAPGSNSRQNQVTTWRSASVWPAGGMTLVPLTRH